MISLDSTFCTIPSRRLDLCKTCERHIKHESNKVLLKGNIKPTSQQQFMPVKAKDNTYSCIGWVTYPMKD